MLWHWILTFTGSNNESGTAYGFWSGFGSDIGEVVIIGGLVSMYRKHNCEVHGCWRLGRHRTAGGHVVCRTHHPDDRLTAEQVAEAHDRAKRQPGQGKDGEQDMTRLERTVVIIGLILAVAAGGLGAVAAWQDHVNYQAQMRAAQVRGQQIERKLCTSFAKLAAIQPPAGNPQLNPSRAYEAQTHAVLIQIGYDIGCGDV